MKVVILVSVVMFSQQQKWNKTLWFAYWALSSTWGLKMPIKKATCLQFTQPTVGMGLSSWPSHHIELACAKLCAVFCEPLPSIIYRPENMDIVAISAVSIWGNFLIPYSEHSWGSPAAADRLLPAETLTPGEALVLNEESFWLLDFSRAQFTPYVGGGGLAQLHRIIEKLKWNTFFQRTRWVVKCQTSKMLIINGRKCKMPHSSIVPMEHCPAGRW